MLFCNRKVNFDHFCYGYCSACMFQSASFVFINTKSCSKIWLCLRNQDKNLSFQDCTVLYYALNGDYKLLTGDRNLRVIAERHGLQVSGIIYVMDELLHHDILSKEEYITKLKALLESNHRLPTKEIMKRIENSFRECQDNCSRK